MRSKISWFLCFSLALAGAIGTYFLTDRVFRWQKIPYPFERFGLSAAAGLFCWVMGIGTWVIQKVFKGGNS